MVPAARARRIVALALLLGAARGTAHAQALDPFAPAQRWTVSPSPAAQWIPASLDFAGEDWVLAAAVGAAPQWLWLSTSKAAMSGSIAAEAAWPAAAGTLSNMVARTGDSPRELYGLAQAPDPDAAHRRTEVARFDPLGANPLVPLWVHDMIWRVGGAARLAVSADGARACAVLHDSAVGRLRIDQLDGASGALLSRADISGGTLRQLCASDDLARVAFAAGSELWVLDAQGAVVHHELLASAAQALSISRDGTTLLVGAPGLLRVLTWTGASYAERARETAPAAEIPVRCALSQDGAGWAAAWWNATSGRDVRLELRAQDLLVWSELQSALPSAPQNFPESVCLSRDGRRAAFGLWGSQDSQPEVVLADRDTAASVVRLDLPGSALALALDPSGTRLAIAMKHAHANQLATSGEVRLFDTGERALQALDQARAGVSFPVAARRPGAPAVWFLYGPRAATGQALPGIRGTLWLTRSSLRALRVPTDASGRADTSFLLPANPGLLFSIQALFRSAPAQLSAQVLDPLSL